MAILVLALVSGGLAASLHAAVPHVPDHGDHACAVCSHLHANPARPAEAATATEPPPRGFTPGTDHVPGSVAIVVVPASRAPPGPVS